MRFPTFPTFGFGRKLTPRQSIQKSRIRRIQQHAERISKLTPMQKLEIGSISYKDRRKKAFSKARYKKAREKFISKRNPWFPW